MSEPVVVKLRKPIESGNSTITQLTFRPMKAKDLRRVKSSDSGMESTLKMAGWLSGQVDVVIDELEGADLAEVLAIVNSFFLAIQETGEK